MGTITITLVEGGQTNITRTYTISDAHIARARTALQQDANTAINGTATRAQVWNTWVTGVMNALVEKTKNAELSVAQAAVVTPTPITPV